MPGYSINNISEDKTGYDLFTFVSHLVMDPALELSKDCADIDKIHDMKRRVVGFAEPLFTLINGIPEDSKVSLFSLGATGDSD